MSDPTPERDQRSRNDRPVMGDHPDLETDEEISPAPARPDNPMARFGVAGIIVLVIVVIIILYFIFA